MAKDGIEPAADLVVSNAYWNPRPLERDVVFCRAGEIGFCREYLSRPARERESCCLSSKGGRNIYVSRYPRWNAHG